MVTLISFILFLLAFVLGVLIPEQRAFWINTSFYSFTFFVIAFWVRAWRNARKVKVIIMDNHRNR